MKFNILKACHALEQGKLVVYPTEAVYGIGCLANDEGALKKLRKLKQREGQKGLIILCASRQQLQKYFPEIRLSHTQLERLEQKQSHPTTWLLPYGRQRRPLLSGNNNRLAIRITQHPVARILCERCGPIVSSSANPAGIKTPKTLLKIRKYFRNNVDLYLNESLGDAGSPSQIIDLTSGEIIRSA